MLFSYFYDAALFICFLQLDFVENIRIKFYHKYCQSRYGIINWSEKRRNFAYRRTRPRSNGSVLYTGWNWNDWNISSEQSFPLATMGNSTQNRAWQFMIKLLSLESYRPVIQSNAFYACHLHHFNSYMEIQQDVYLSRSIPKMFIHFCLDCRWE